MKMRSLLPMALLAMAVGVSAGDAAGPKKEAKAVKAEGAITLDGKLDDEAWKKAPLFTGFERLLTNADGRTPIPENMQTSFQVVYDDSAIYFGVRCNEPEMDKLCAYGVTEQWDAAMWCHDDIELFLDPVADRREKYQFAVDPNGAQFDGYTIEGGSTGKPYSAIWQAKTFKGKDYWSAEIAIPFASLYHRPSAMWSDSWVFSIARSRLGGGKQETYYSKFSPTNRGYHDMVNYGTLSGVKVDTTRFNLSPEKPTLRLEPTESGFKLFASLTIRNTAPTPFEGTLSLELLGKDCKGAERPLKIDANGAATVTIDDAFVKTEGVYPLLLRVTNKEKRLLLATRYDEKILYEPLMLTLTQPNYRGCIYDTQKIDAVKGVVKLGMPVEQVKDCKLVFTLSSPLMAPRKVEKAADAVVVSFEIPAADLPVGRHALSVELLRPIANAKPPQRLFDTVAETQATLRKLPHAPDVEVRIDDQGNFLVDGKPFMIRGWYGSLGYCVSSASLPQANLPHSTNFIMGGGADNVWCVVDVSRQIDEDKAKLNPPLDEGLKAKLRAVIASVQGRRNVLGYYLADEPCYRAVPADYLKRIYDFLVEEDPFRFVLVVDVAPEDYIKACDAICPHPYSSPLEYEDGSRKFGSGLEGIHNCITKAVQANNGSKAVWLMPQVFSYGGAQGRNPTFTELRWIMLSGIANGAKGLVPFIFCGYWNHASNRVASDAVFEELTLVEPFWNARDSATGAKADDVRIDVCAKNAKLSADGPSHTVVVAVNRSYEPRKAKITIESLAKNKNTRLLVLRENRVIPVENGSFTDDFEGLGAHVYTTVEALPHLKTLVELKDEIAAPRKRAAAEGNILAKREVRWKLGASGAQYVEGEGMPFGDGDFTDGLLDGYAWFPAGKPTGECVIVFEKPVSFSRIVCESSNIKDADVDVWDGKEWKTLHQWKDQFLERMEWKGAKTTTDRIRIKVTGKRLATGSWVSPEISQLGIFE